MKSDSPGVTSANPDSDDTFGNYEREVWTWACNVGLSLEEVTHCLEAARRSAVERMLECLTRERLLALEQDTASVLFPSAYRTNDPGSFCAGEQLCIPLPRCGGQIRFTGKCLMLGRLQIESALIYQIDQSATPLAPRSLVNLLEVEISHGDGDWPGLWRDFLQSSVTGFLLRVLRLWRSSDQACLGLVPTARNGDECVVALEQWAIEGHFLHPCPKARPGLSMADNLAYSPEAGAAFRLRLATLESPRVLICTASTKVDAAQWMPVDLRDALCARGMSLETQSVVFPLHPLQLKCADPPLKEDSGLILVEFDGPMAQPLTAYRSVYLPDSQVYIKLPLRVRMTSAARTLSIKPRVNSVELTRLLDCIAGKGDIPQSLIFLREEMSVGPVEGDPLLKDVGFILRETCAKHIKAGEVVIPAFCLFEAAPETASNTILDGMLRQYCGPKGHSGELIKRFLVDYATLYISPCLRLLTTYGIGLEAHLENSLTVFEDGRPTRALYRDNDAVSICAPRLQAGLQVTSAAFHPDSWSVSDDPFGAQEKLQHSLIHSHLGEIIKAIATTYAIAERELWNTLSDLILKEFSEMKELEHIREAAIEDEVFFLRPSVELKSLTRMRLANIKNRYLYTSAKNPLSYPSGR